MKADELLGSHYFLFDPREAGSLSLSLETKFIANGDCVNEKEGIFWNQFLKLQSDCNEATFGLYGTILTPDRLRQLANELEREELKIRAKFSASE